MTASARTQSFSRSRSVRRSRGVQRRPSRLEQVSTLYARGVGLQQGEGRLIPIPGCKLTERTHHSALKSTLLGGEPQSSVRGLLETAPAAALPVVFELWVRWAVATPNPARAQVEKPGTQGEDHDATQGQ